jgi:hypothetical protein
MRPRTVERLIIMTLASALGGCAPSFGSGWPSWAQEERACAGLGLDPGSADFASCVGNLDATMRQDASLDH